MIKAELKPKRNRAQVTVAGDILDLSFDFVAIVATLCREFAPYMSDGDSVHELLIDLVKKGVDFYESEVQDGGQTS